jgi:hypothetical protein
MLKLFKENIRIAPGSIRTQLLRTVLTVLIIAIGITALEYSYGFGAGEHHILGFCIDGSQYV